ncbi:MAG: hypothetical protein MUP82_09330 [Candidatus Marinimicrobia bacterium]|nr:hypothetical protein [Candidatus Neomarinimicrobiota bacterium]
MVKHNKRLTDILNHKLSEDIDNNMVQEIADYIKKCEDCKMDVDTIQQTIKLARTGDFEVLIPPGVSKRLFKVLGLDEE